MDAFRDELSAIETRTLRTEEERDEARREVDDLKANVIAMRATKTRKTSRSMYVVALLGFVGLGWLVSSLLLRPLNRPTPNETPPIGGSGAVRAPAIEAKPVIASTSGRTVAPLGPRRLQWRKLAATCEACTGVTRSSGPMMLGKHGATYSLFQAGSPAEKMLRDDAPVPVDLLAGTTVIKPAGTGIAVVVGRAEERVGWAASRELDGPGGKPKWTKERIHAIEEDLLAAVVDESFVFAVGERGTIVRRDAFGVWAKEPSGTGLTLRAVGVTADKRVIAAGDGGTIVLRDELDPSVPSKWHTIASPTQAVLRTIVTSGKSTWIAGDQGTLLGMLLGNVENFWVKKDPPVSTDFVSGTSWNGGDLALATRHGEIVDVQSDGRFAVERVTMDDVLGIMLSIEDLVLVTTTGRIWTTRRAE